MTNDQNIYVFDWTRGKDCMDFYTESKYDFMQFHGLQGECGGDYEVWRGSCPGLDDVQDCRTKDEALDFLKDVLGCNDITQEQYDELVEKVKAA